MRVPVVTVIFLILIITKLGKTLKCYTCSLVSRPDIRVPTLENAPDCPDDGTVTKITALKCDNTSNRCVKYEFKHGADYGIYRGCVDNTYCAKLDLIKGKVHGESYTCNICSRDRCNGSARVQASPPWLGPILLTYFHISKRL